MQVKISAENISEDKTVISGGQFFIVDEKDQKHKAVYGPFSSKELGRRIRPRKTN